MSQGLVTGHRHGHDVGERLYVHRHTPVHLLPGETKIVAIVGFVFVVVSTPVTDVWAFPAYLLALGIVAGLSRVPIGVIGPRMLVELPILLFALLMPITGPDPHIELGPLSLSQPGMWAAWGILAKATLGVIAGILLAATTPTRDLLSGLRNLRVPAALVSIAGFMLRYIHVVGAELERMRVARESRGFQGRGVRSWPVVARTAGALFIRCYERGERVHLAMLSRGFTGVMPELDELGATPRQWVTALCLPGLALLVRLGGVVA